MTFTELYNLELRTFSEIRYIIYKQSISPEGKGQLESEAIENAAEDAGIM